MLMVISSKLAHDALRQFKPPAACAETLELRHFNFAQMEGWPGFEKNPPHFDLTD